MLEGEPRINSGDGINSKALVSEKEPSLTPRGAGYCISSLLFNLSAGVFYNFSLGWDRKSLRCNISYILETQIFSCLTLT